MSAGMELDDQGADENDAEAGAGGMLRGHTHHDTLLPPDEVSSEHSVD